MKQKNRKIKPSKVALLAQKALKKAIANVIEEHRQKGLPLVFWKKGRVVRVPANKL